jgi:hypothetical protein
VIMRLAKAEPPSTTRHYHREGPVCRHRNPPFLTTASAKAERLATPSLVPICTRPGGSDRATHRSGAGFLINYRSRPVFVTARHVLYGHKSDEDPFTKHIVFKGRLRGLFELQSEKVLQDCNNELVAVYVGELGLLECLPMSCLSSGEALCALIQSRRSRTALRMNALIRIASPPRLRRGRRMALLPGSLGISPGRARVALDRPAGRERLDQGVTARPADQGPRLSPRPPQRLRFMAAR